MVKYCCVRGCGSSNDKKKFPDVMIFSLASDERRPAWLAEVRKSNGPDWTPSQSTRICSRHFLPKDFWQRPRKRSLLLPRAIPHITPSSALPPASEIVRSKTPNVPVVVYRKRKAVESIAKKVSPSESAFNLCSNGRASAEMPEAGRDVVEASQLCLQTSESSRQVLEDVTDIELHVSKYVAKTADSSPPQDEEVENVTVTPISKMCQAPPCAVTPSCPTTLVASEATTVQRNVISSTCGPSAAPSKPESSSLIATAASFPYVPVCLDVDDDDPPREKVLKLHILGLEQLLAQSRKEIRKLRSENKKVNAKMIRLKDVNAKQEEDLKVLRSEIRKGNKNKAENQTVKAKMIQLKDVNAKQAEALKAFRLDIKKEKKSRKAANKTVNAKMIQLEDVNAEQAEELQILPLEMSLI